MNETTIRLIPPPTIYIAGPYTAPTAWGIEQNIRRAEAEGMAVARLGGFPVIPHTNTRSWFAEVQPYEFWLAGTIKMMRSCDAAYFIAGHARSDGANKEYRDQVDGQRPALLDIDQVATFIGLYYDRKRKEATIMRADDGGG